MDLTRSEEAKSQSSLFCASRVKVAVFGAPTPTVSLSLIASDRDVEASNKGHERTFMLLHSHFMPFPSFHSCFLWRQIASCMVLFGKSFRSLMPALRNQYRGAFLQVGCGNQWGVKQWSMGKAFCVNFWLFHVSGKLWINFHSSCVSTSAIDFQFCLFSLRLFSGRLWMERECGSETEPLRSGALVKRKTEKYRKGKIDESSRIFFAFVREITRTNLN